MVTRRAWAAFIAATPLLAVAADADTPPSSQETSQPQVVPPPKNRVLNGHVFMPSAAVPGALPTTSFASYLVLGIGETSGSFQVGSRTFSGNYQYAGVGAVLGYEQAFLDNFSARLTINDIIYSGINGESALAVGTQLRVGFTVGLTASLPIGDSLRVAALIDAGSVPALALTIGSGLSRIINSCTQPGGCNVDSGSVFSTQNATTIQPALAASWAPIRPLGVTANVAYLHVSQDLNTGASVSGDAMSLGLASDFDFRAVSSVPIGLMLQLSWTAPVSGTANLQHVTDVGGGIFYTGRQNLALGLQVVSRRFAVTPDVKVDWSTFISTVGLRYYW